MNCPEFCNLIPELLDHACELQTANRMLQHAKGCSECARELEASKQALAAATPSPKLTASPRFTENTMKRIMEMETASSQIKSSASFRLSNRLWQYALGAAAIVAIVLTFTFAGGPTVGFAQVVGKLAAAHAFSFTALTTIDKLGEMKMTFSYMEPGKMRMEMGGKTTTILDSGQHKGLLLNHDEKNYLEIDLSNTPVSAAVVSEMNHMETLRNLVHSAGEPTEVREENGRKLQGFRATMAPVTYLIWADAKTGDIVKAEYEMSEPVTGKGVLSDFKFDSPADETLFDLRPPEDYKPMLPSGVAITPPSEESFVKFLRMYATEFGDNHFPRSMDAVEIMRKLMGDAHELAKLPEAQRMAKIFDRIGGSTFARTFLPENDFHYQGAGVALGTAGTPICWYKPWGSTTYRVIYGDLTVKDVPPDQAPKPALKATAQDLPQDQIPVSK
jgi:outer membrane lipoprotein-sorting protein